MKNFSKLVFTSLFVLAVAPAFSQFSGGLDLALPTGTISNSTAVGLGLSARYEAQIASVDKLNWTASAGFLTFLGKSQTTTAFGVTVTTTGQSTTVIPLVGGVKYYFQDADKGFYGALDVGIYIATGGYSSAYFGQSPGIGYRTDKWDFTGRINFVSDVTFLGLRGAYFFGK